MWKTAPKQLELSDQNIHVWRADLNLPQARIKQLVDILSSDEIDRANRFHFEKDRKRFIAGRGILRSLLSRYLDLDPRALQFAYSDRGKPSLFTDTPENIDFNLSHSNELVLYAFARNAAIGVDIEYLRQMSDIKQLAKRFFSLREYEAIAQLPPSEQQRAFFQAWTCKEAFLKAKGDGLAGGLEKVEVSLAPGETAKLLSISEDKQAALGWSLYQLTPHPDYMAALAIERRDGQLSFWAFSPNGGDRH